MSVLALVLPGEIAERDQQMREEGARGVLALLPETICRRCVRPNVWSWYVGDEVWNAVMRPDDPSIICPPCFTSLAAERGVYDGSWRLSIDGRTS